MAKAQGITSLKLQNHLKMVFYPANWIAGVDYEPENPETYEDAEDEHYKDDASDDDTTLSLDEEDLDEEEFDRIDQDKINDLLNDESAQDTNPTIIRQSTRQSTPPTWRGIEIVPNTTPDEPGPQEREAQVQEGTRPTRNVEPIERFVSYKAICK